MSTAYRPQRLRTRSVVPLAVGTDGRVYQLPPEISAAWPIRYIMTFEGGQRPLRVAFVALFTAIFPAVSGAR